MRTPSVPLRCLCLGPLVALAAALCPRAAGASAPPPESAPAAGTAAGAGAPAAGRLPSVRASRESLQLGVDTEAELTLELPEGAREVRVQASCGSVEDLREQAPGRWTARYRPPAPLYPQLAIIAVTAQHAASPVHAWTVLPLWGKGRAVVRTRPGKETLLRIGVNRFGPVRADAAGVARVAVVVPPGFREGWAGEQRVDLQLPPVPRVYAMLGQTRVSADAEAQVPVRVYAVTAEGAPREGARFGLEAQRGALGALRELGPGVLEAHWALPPGPSGAVALRGASPDGAETFEASVQVEPGPARSARLGLQPEALVAGAVEALVAQVEAFDRGGNRVAAPLQLRWALGPPQALHSSAAQAVALQVPVAGDFRGQERAALQVLGPDGAVLAAREVPLRAGAPARLAVDGAPGWLEPDGHTPVVLRVAVHDRFGNPVREPAPRVLSATEQLSAPRAGADGGWELRFVPAPLAHARAARVEVHAGGLAAHRVVQLLPYRPRLSAALRAGLLANGGTVRSPTAGLQLHLWPRRLHADLGLSLDLGYLPLGADARGAPGLEDFQGSARAWLLAAGPSWRLRPRAGLELWVGAGPSLARLSARTALGGAAPLESSGAALGAQAWLGLGRRLGPGAPFVELRGVALGDPGLATLRGALLAGSLQLGYRLDLR